MNISCDRCVTINVNINIIHKRLIPMATYFPYSYIIESVSEYKPSVIRHEYFGDWNVGDAITTAQSSRLEISEIYY